MNDKAAFNDGSGAGNPERVSALEGIEPVSDVRSLKRPAGDDRRQTLIQHLQSLAHGHKAHEVIQLLHDIRAHQAHPRMQEAFENNRDNTLAHSIRNHQNDILDLLVDDYLEHMNLPDEMDEETLRSLDQHLVDNILNRLRDFHEVVEEIRDEVQTVSQRFEADPSIAHVSDLIREIRDHMDHEMVQSAARQLHHEHLSHHIFQAHNSHLSPTDALATAWVQYAHKKGERVHDRDAAVSFVREQLHPHLVEQFGQAVEQSKLNRSTSGVVPKGAAPGSPSVLTLSAVRHQDKQFDTAFTILEELQRQFAHLADQSEEAERLVASLSQQDDVFGHYVATVMKSSDETVESITLKGREGMLQGEDITEYFKSRLDTLASVYVLTTLTSDEERIDAYERLQTVKERFAAADEPGRQRILEAVKESDALIAVLENDADQIYACLVNTWKEQGGNDVTELNRLVDEAVTATQSYLNDPLDNLDIVIPRKKHGEGVAPSDGVPLSQAEILDDSPNIRSQLRQEYSEAPVGTDAYAVRKLLRVIKLNALAHSDLQRAIISNLEFHAFLDLFSGENTDVAVIDQYFGYREDLGVHAGSLETYLNGVAKAFKEHCGDELYQELLDWNEFAPASRKPRSFSQLTSPKPPAPPPAKPPAPAKRKELPPTVPPPRKRGKGEASSTESSDPLSIKSPPPPAGDLYEAVGAELESPHDVPLDEPFDDKPPSSPATIREGRGQHFRPENPWESDGDRQAPIVRTQERRRHFEEGSLRTPTIRPWPPTLNPSGGTASVPVTPTSEKVYIDQDSTFKIDKGEHVDVVYAMQGSTLEVENGARLNVFMVDEGTTIVLKGPRAQLRIDQVSHLCNSFKIIDDKGDPVTNKRNLELGEGVAEKIRN